MEEVKSIGMWKVVSAEQVVKGEGLKHDGFRHMQQGEFQRTGLYEAHGTGA